MTNQFRPYPGFDPMEGDEPGMTLSRDNPVRPMTEEEVERAHDRAASEPVCDWCGGSPIREVLDGDALCQSCCDKWVRGEAPDPRREGMDHG